MQTCFATFDKENGHTGSQCLSRSSIFLYLKLFSWVLILIHGGANAKLLSIQRRAPAFAIPTPVVDFGLGAVAGATGAVVSYPFDFVKSQLQTEIGRAKYKNGIEAAVDIVSTDGPLSLYRGIGVQIAGVAPEKAIKLSVNDIVRNGIRSASGGGLPLWGELLAGAMAGFCQVIVTNPTEVMKVGLQTSGMTIGELFQEIGGFSGLYKGSAACITRDIIFSLTLFPLYAHFREFLPPLLLGPGAVSGDSVVVDILAAGGAAAPAALIATPADFVKTRIQSQDECSVSVRNFALADGDCVIDNTTIFPADVGYSSIENPIVLMTEISKREGPAVLFSGSFERIVRSLPQFGVTLVVFDHLKKFAMENHLL